MDILSFALGMNAGKASGGGSSGGGGALPAGTYFEQIEPIMPGTYFGKHFVFKDELYLWQKTVSSGSGCKYYKFANDQYTEILATDSYAEPINTVVVLGDLVHMITGTYHYVFDGSTQTRLNACPKGWNSVFVHNGELYGSYSSSSYLYKWKPDTDEWVETDIPQLLVGATFVFNGEIYAIKYNKNLYQLKNGEYVQLCTAPVNLDLTVRFVGKDGCLYIPSSSIPGACYKFDSVNNAFVEAFTMPHFSNNYYIYEYNGEIRVGGGTDNELNHMRLHIIE